MYPTVRVGAVFINQDSYGAVGFSFQEGKNPKARFNRTVPIKIEVKARECSPKSNIVGTSRLYISAHVRVHGNGGIG